MGRIKQIDQILEFEVNQALGHCKQGLSLEAQAFVRNEVGNICGTLSGNKVTSISPYQRHDSNSIYHSDQIAKQTDKVSRNIQDFLCDSMKMEMEMIELMNISHMLFVAFVNYICIERCICPETGIYTSGNVLTYHEGGKKHRKQFGPKNTQADALGNLLIEIREPKRNIDQVETTALGLVGKNPDTDNSDALNTSNATYMRLKEKEIIEETELGEYRIAGLVIKDSRKSSGQFISIHRKGMSAESSISDKSFEQAFQIVINRICSQKGLGPEEKNILLKLKKRSLYPDQSTRSKLAKIESQGPETIPGTDMSAERFSEINAAFDNALKENEKQ